MIASLVLLNPTGTSLALPLFASNPLANADFQSRAAMLAAQIPTYLWRISCIHGGIICTYQRGGAANQTADGEFWKPADFATFQHYGAVCDGVTDDTTAALAALAVNRTVWLFGDMAISGELELDNRSIRGQNWSTSIITGLAAMPTTDALLAIGRQGFIRDCRLRYEAAAIDHTETDGERVALRLNVGTTNATKTLAGWADLRISDCGTAIYSDEDPFNVSMGRAYISAFTWKGYHGPVGTGMTWEAIYFEGEYQADPSRSVENVIHFTNDVATDGASGTVLTLGQTNIHLCRIRDAAIKIDRVNAVSFTSMHIENNALVSNGAAFFDLEHSTVTIENLKWMSNGSNVTDPSFALLGDGGQTGPTGSTSFVSPTSTFSVRNLVVQATNTIATHVDAGFTPRGWENCPTLKYFRRKSGATGEYVVRMPEGFNIQIYNGNNTAQERARHRAIIGGSDLGITFIPSKPVDNLIQNAGFDTWVATSVTGTGGTPAEFATGWFAKASGAAQVRASRIAAAAGGGGNYHVRFENLGNSGSLCRIYTKLFDVRPMLGQDCVFSFEAKAASAGRALEDITCELDPGVGGSGTGLFARIVLGDDARAQFTTSWQRFEFQFTALDESVVSVWGTNPFFELNFRITASGGTRQSDIELRNPQMEIGTTANPFTRRIRA